MLELKNITKDYRSGAEVVHALKGVSLKFRDSEFVSILGQSGCGKTTLLNIIGGLDQYTSGDLIINGKSTKEYKNKDWDVYRNHSVGFVFQSYNLIPHQTVLANVELALTLSGVSKSERRKRAMEVLDKVGLSSQIHKKPNQMSGGQMQRVAIARALINDPDILLADEPTGALDSETSVQVMEILKEISKDKLVVMVTHNPELAKQYSTRIIRLLDGEVTDDSAPCADEEKDLPEKEKKDRKKGKKTSMSFYTALSLSLNNLFTKKGRTILTSFAGSIGIIGIALILSFSNGVQTYINGLEEDTLSGYPITIEESTMDMTVIMEAMQSMNQSDVKHDDGKVHSTPMVNDIITAMADKQEKNNLKDFKVYLEEHESELNELTSDIQYGYGFDLNIYNADGVGGIVRVNPNEILNKMGFGEMAEVQSMMGTEQMSGTTVFSPIIGGETLLNSQYEVIAGNWPQNDNEVVLELDQNGNISDYTLYSLGLMDQDELVDNYNALMSGEEVKDVEEKTYTYEELLDISFKLLLNTDFYQKENGVWVDKSSDEEYMKTVCEDALTIDVVGIVMPKESSVSGNRMGGVLYPSGLQDYVIDHVGDSEIAKEQQENPDINVFTGMAFSGGKDLDMESLTQEQQMQLAAMSEQERTQFMQTYAEQSSATYDSNLRLLGVVDRDNPASISIYAKDFDSKESVAQLIEDYNTQQTNAGNEGNVITYSDIVGTMMDSVTMIVDIVSYVLIAFVSVSLIVSSIMIGIITYISVLERTKEIGILRAIGASKKDISRVFNAETFIVGLCAGVLGIGITLLLNIPINYFLGNALGVSGLASLPVAAAAILIVLSMLLTVIAGLIPSRIAAKKDPVVALRTE